ncbi:hypothetical protein Ssi03_75650 [Sphaerisporangium siamense]|uniref:Uncharacterized protein n=1 Tax=Sphaerisporangium siamense TaxID=795645 RepID=A0A7W7G7I9_9ACTN|nr:hypothetical protein [Sphaerisporangium siamense]GII89575.1 hypothetical protein Ssi03_75650 [Sphaerisporangium siamense]
MTTLLPLAVIALGVAGIFAFVIVLVGVRQEDRRMRLPVTPETSSAAFARRVIGVHVRDNRPGRGDADVSLAATGGACQTAGATVVTPRVRAAQ